MKKNLALPTSLICLFFTFSVLGADLKDFHYLGQDELPLKGDWMFYWEQLLSPDDSIPKGTGFKVTLPNYWNDHQYDGYIPQSFGYATYMTTIVSDKQRDIALEYAPPHCAQRIFLNNKLLIETGKVGTTPETYEALWLPGTIKTQLNQGKNELIFQISNFDHSKGGLYEAPVIGRPAILLAKRDRKLLLDSFVVGGLFILGTFFLGLSIFWRNNSLFTYFGLFASSFSFWFSNYGMYIFNTYFPDISWDVSIHLTYLSFYGFLLFISLFVYVAFKRYFNKYYLNTILIGYILAFSTVIFGSQQLFTSCLIYVHVMVLCQFVYTVILLVNTLRKGAIVGFLSVLALILASLTTLGIFYNFLPWVSETVGLLFLVTFLFFAFLMAMKVGGSYKSVLQLQQKSHAQKEMIQKQATKLQILDELKSRFFANVSHDLRSPLTLINGNLSKIKREDNTLTEASKNSLESINSNVTELIQFTDEIRDLNLLDQKGLSVSYERLELNQFLEGISNMFHSVAEIRKIDLSFLPHDKEVFIHGDANKLRKVFNNLLSNAFKFTNDHGTITLSVKNTGYGLSIAVEDSGVGIAQEEQSFIFDRFYQSKENIYRSEEGMGIGLALVKEFTTLHGGKVSLQSKKEQGSVFSVFLPFNHDKPIDVVNRERIVEVDDFQLVKKPMYQGSDLAIDFKSKGKSVNHTILLVDDHHEVRRYIASLIDQQHSVIEAKNGMEAYDLLKKQQVDLVITDLMMPWMDGFELIDKINKDTELSKTKIMVVSARTTKEDKLKVLSHGVNEFISKPFDEEEFNSRIVNILKGDEPSILHDLADKKGKYSDIEQNILLKVNNLIMKEIDNSKFSIAMLADELATSERNANRVIQKLTGHPPKSYIQKVRINYAELLLQEKKVKSLTEAGHSVGIQNATQFAKQFEKVKGYHPSKISLTPIDSKQPITN